MPWVILSIVTAFAWAVCNVIDKAIFIRWKIHPDLYFILISIAFFLSGVVVLVFRGFPAIPADHLLSVVASVVLFFLCFIFYCRAVTREEVSRVVPLWYLSPLFILIFAAIFLHERLAPFHLMGVVLLVFGAMTITSRGLFSRPRWDIILLMAAADVCFAVSAVIGKYLIDQGMDVWTLYAHSRLAGVVVVVPTVMMYAPLFRETIRKQGGHFLWFIATDEVINVFGDIAWLVAIAAGSVTLVTALTSLQPFFVFFIALILGVLIPRLLSEERASRSILAFKFASIASIVIGALLITTVN